MRPVNHEQQLNSLIYQHFDEADGRVDVFYDRHIGSSWAVMKRHWRNKKDIPHDLLVLPRSLYLLVRRAYTSKQSDQALSSLKQKELARLLETQLLDLPGLEEKIKKYCAVHEHELQGVIQDLFADLSDAEQQTFKQLLSDHLNKLHIPSEGLRETIVFSVIGMAGKLASQEVLFGSSMAAGQAIAFSLYMSQQGFLAALWYKFSGAPLWVSIAGGASGLIAMLAMVPIISPITELAVNKMRGKKILRQVVGSARDELTEKGEGEGADIPSMVGQLAIYLQAIPDLSVFAKSAIGIIR